MEISVVILMIGLLIAGISKGTDMIGDFRIQTARNLTTNAPMLRMSGLTVWLDTVSKESFDIEVDVKDSTKNKVSEWNDLNPLSNNKFDMIQPTASLQPTLINDPKMNNLPVFLFDGVDDNFYRLNVLGSDFAQTDQITMFFVQNFSPLQTSNLFTWLPGGLEVQIIRYHSQWTDGNTYFDFPHGTSTGRIYTTLDNKYTNVGNITTLIHKSSGVGNIRTNGHKLFSTDTAQTAVIDTSSSATFYIGAQIVANATNPFKGNLGEVIIFNRALKEGEINSVEQYLSQKWGIKLIP